MVLVVPVTMVTSKVTDHRLPCKYNNKNVWSIVRITKMWQTDSLGKMVPVDLLDVGLPQTSSLSKTQYLWISIKMRYACTYFVSLCQNYLQKPQWKLRLFVSSVHIQHRFFSLLFYFRVSPFYFSYGLFPSQCLTPCFVHIKWSVNAIKAKFRSVFCKVLMYLKNNTSVH